MRIRPSRGAGSMRNAVGLLAAIVGMILGVIVSCSRREPDAVVKDSPRAADYAERLRREAEAAEEGWKKRLLADARGLLPDLARFDGNVAITRRDRVVILDLADDRVSPANNLLPIDLRGS